MKETRRWVVVLLLLGVNALRAAQAPPPPRPADALDPITAILDAFRAHPVVALGEGAHGNEQGHAFRLSLIRDPRFAALVNDIIVEGGNARYQDLVNRFVRGEAVPNETLRLVWQDSTQVQLVLESPLLGEFLRAVSALNSSVPPTRQLRVWLSDPPIDWNDIHNAGDHRKWLEMRDSYPADLIQREVLAKKRRALVVYGDMHFQRKNVAANYESEGLAETIVSRLEHRIGTKVFSIHTITSVDLTTLQPDIASWPKPSLALIHGTVLGATDFTFYYPLGLKMPRFVIRDGRPDLSVTVPRDQWRSLRMEDQFDAAMYLGPPSSITFATPSTTLCADAAYIEIRLARMALVELPPVEADRLKQFCSAVLAK